MKKVQEKNLRLRQILGIMSLIAIIANILFRFAFRTYGDTVFWLVIIVAAIIAWPVMNWLKKANL
jgi:hypothetical protein